MVANSFFDAVGKKTEPGGARQVETSDLNGGASTVPVPSGVIER